MNYPTPSLLLRGFAATPQHHQQPAPLSQRPLGVPYSPSPQECPSQQCRHSTSPESIYGSKEHDSPRPNAGQAQDDNCYDVPGLHQNNGNNFVSLDTHGPQPMTYFPVAERARLDVDAIKQLHGFVMTGSIRTKPLSKQDLSTRTMTYVLLLGLKKKLDMLGGQQGPGVSNNGLVLQGKCYMMVYSATCCVYSTIGKELVAKLKKEAATYNLQNVFGPKAVKNVKTLTSDFNLEARQARDQLRLLLTAIQFCQGLISNTFKTAKMFTLACNYKYLQHNMTDPIKPQYLYQNMVIRSFIVANPELLIVRRKRHKLGETDVTGHDPTEEHGSTPGDEDLNND
ncbi:hypothetical protein CPB85DRAFT_1258566 [Mucidula mucida]|nr:hypothetical protein CPB85DRAFT_1258566 [Mucidula mucida]